MSRLAGQTAILGGSFDPIHNGHLALARAALESFELARVVFLPVANSPGKALSGMFSDQKRVELIRGSIQDEERFSLSELELIRGGPSYTLETALSLGAQEGDPVYWIVGADCLGGLKGWHRAEELARLVHFLAAEREGLPLISVAGFTIHYFVCPRVEVSSSLVRERVRAKASLVGLVPDAILEMF